MRKTCICAAPCAHGRPFCADCWATLTTDDQDTIRYSRDRKVRRRVILRCERTLMEQVRERIDARLAATAAAQRRALPIEDCQLPIAIPGPTNRQSEIQNRQSL